MQMAPLAVHVKHAGKTLDVELDPTLPPAVFKEAIYQVTGVPPERMKVMIKGGMLKVCLSSCSRYMLLHRGSDGFVG
jgi:ubiquitin carboxyl-terminal hydrolase 14